MAMISSATTISTTIRSKVNSEFILVFVFLLFRFSFVSQFLPPLATPLAPLAAIHRTKRSSGSKVNTWCNFLFFFFFPPQFQLLFFRFRFCVLLNNVDIGEGRFEGRHLFIRRKRGRGGRGWTGSQPPEGSAEEGDQEEEQKEHVIKNDQHGRHLVHNSGHFRNSGIATLPVSSSTPVNATLRRCDWLASTIFSNWVDLDVVGVVHVGAHAPQVVYIVAMATARWRIDGQSRGWWRGGVDVIDAGAISRSCWYYGETWQRCSLCNVGWLLDIPPPPHPLLLLTTHHQR